MRISMLLGGLCVVVAGLFVSGSALSQSSEEGKPPTLGPYAPEIPSQSELMKAMVDAKTPGKFHKRLEYFLGEWDYDVKIWMGGPGSQAIESKGGIKYRWQIEGLWLMSESTGSLMGMSLGGAAFFGYDNFKRKYVWTGINAMDSQIYQGTGYINPDGNTIILYGTLDEPSMHQVAKHAKYIMRIVDEDTYILELHDLAMHETKTKVVEYTHRRKK